MTSNDVGVIKKEVKESDTEAFCTAAPAPDSLVEVTSRIHRSRVSDATGSCGAGVSDHDVGAIKEEVKQTSKLDKQILLDTQSLMAEQ